MENNIAIISENKEDKTLSIRLKTNQYTHVELYHTIISILEWGKRIHGLDTQEIQDAFKSKNFVEEHYSHPAL